MQASTKATNQAKIGRMFTNMRAKTKKLNKVEQANKKARRQANKLLQFFATKEAGIQSSKNRDSK